MQMCELSLLHAEIYRYATAGQYVRNHLSQLSTTIYKNAIFRMDYLQRRRHWMKMCP